MMPDKFRGNELYYLSNDTELFAERELGWKRLRFSDFSPEQLEKINQNTIILFLGNSTAELEFLEGLPSLKVWLWMYGDETFNPVLNFIAIRHPSVIGVIRPYPLQMKRLYSDLMSCLKFLVTETKFKNWLPTSLFMFSKFFVASIIRVLRIHFVKFLHFVWRKQYINFIPGYTNLFAKNFIDEFKIQITCHSLIESALRCEVKADRDVDVSFVGQSGSPNRLKALSIFNKNKSNMKTFVKTREGFGGTEGSNGASTLTSREYIQILLRSRYVLCPSGHYSGATFRWLETLILGAVPIQSRRIPPDPTFDFLTSYPLGTTEPWKALLSRAELMKEEERLQWLRNLLSSLQASVVKLNNQIRSTTLKGDAT